MRPARIAMLAAMAVTALLVSQCAEEELERNELEAIPKPNYAL